jgi:hypothetical protein
VSFVRFVRANPMFAAPSFEMLTDSRLRSSSVRFVRVRIAEAKFAVPLFKELS